MQSVWGRLGLKKYLAVLLLATATLMLSACPNTPYGKAGKIGLDITDTVKTGADTVDKLRLNGTLTVDEEKMVLHYFDTVNNLTVDVYGPCVKAAHLAGDKASGFLGCVNSLSTSISNPALLQQIRISNPDSQAKVTAIANSIAILAQTGVTLFTTLTQKGQ